MVNQSDSINSMNWAGEKSFRLDPRGGAFIFLMDNRIVVVKTLSKFLTLAFAGSFLILGASIVSIVLCWFLWSL
jgi:hypothetical protein